MQDAFKDGRGEDGREVRKIKFKMADKRAALVDLGRHFALFTDKSTVTHHDGDRFDAVMKEIAEKRIRVTH